MSAFLEGFIFLAARMANIFSDFWRQITISNNVFISWTLTSNKFCSYFLNKCLPDVKWSFLNLFVAEISSFDKVNLVYQSKTFQYKNHTKPMSKLCRCLFIYVFKINKLFVRHVESEILWSLKSFLVKWKEN